MAFHNKEPFSLSLLPRPYQVRIADDSPLRCGKLQIEFDETSQMQRLRFGLMMTEAVFSVLAPWPHGVRGLTAR